MRNRVPARPVVPDFAPVPRKYRHDGWTEERQRAFISALADTGSVKAACARINMSQVGAYYLRRQPGAEEFRRAWIAALDHGVQNLVDLAIDRAIEGVPIPIFHQGAQVGEKRAYNDRLLMFILKHHMPSRYGDRGIGGGTKHPETIARELLDQEQQAMDEAEDLVLRTGRALGILARHHRRKSRAAAAAHLAGDAEAAAILDQQARLIEQAIDQDEPLRWTLSALLSKYDETTAYDAPEAAPPTPTPATTPAKPHARASTPAKKGPAHDQTPPDTHHAAAEPHPGPSRASPREAPLGRAAARPLDRTGTPPRRGRIEEKVRKERN